MPISDISNHARASTQQRGVMPWLLELLDAYGATQHDHSGAAVRYFDKFARRKLQYAEGTVRKVCMQATT